MLVKLFVIALCIGFVMCGDENRIVNGTPAIKNEFPFMVSIRSRLDTHDCGGSILDKQTILTAAHCVCGYSEPFPTIQYGVLTISIDGQTIIRMKEIICHEDFIIYDNDYAHNDIALVKLASPMVLGENARPVQLPSQDFVVTAGAPAVLVGWGLNDTQGAVQSNLQKVNIEIIPEDFCDSAYPGMLVQSNLCAGLAEGGKGQCNGDSGGPLLVDGYQVGIVSWSEKPCASASLPGVFTRITSFIDWINTHK